MNLVPATIVEVDCPTCSIRRTAYVETTLSLEMPTEGAAAGGRDRLDITVAATIVCTVCATTVAPFAPPDQ